MINDHQRAWAVKLSQMGLHQQRMPEPQTRTEIGLAQTSQRIT